MNPVHVLSLFSISKYPAADEFTHHTTHFKYPAASLALIKAPTGEAGIDIIFPLKIYI